MNQEYEPREDQEELLDWSNDQLVRLVPDNLRFQGVSPSEVGELEIHLPKENIINRSSADFVIVYSFLPTPYSGAGSN